MKRRILIVLGCVAAGVVLLYLLRSRGKASAANGEALQIAERGKVSPISGALAVEPTPLPAPPVSIIVEKTKPPGGGFFAYNATPGLKGGIGF